MAHIKKNKRSSALLFLSVCLLTFLATEAPASEFDPVTRRDHAYSVALRRAIENDNRSWLADQISFPLSYEGRKHPKIVRTRKEFLRHYDQIITPDVKKMISRYATEDDFDLFKNSAGMMLARGTIWFIETPDPKEPKKTKYVIITINPDTINLP